MNRRGTAAAVPVLQPGEGHRGTPYLLVKLEKRKGEGEKMRNLGLPAKPRKERFVADVRT